MELQPRDPKQRLAAKKQAQEEEVKRWIISTRTRLKSNPTALAALGLGWGTSPRLPEGTKGWKEQHMEQEQHVEQEQEQQAGLEDEGPQTNLEKQRFRAMVQATQNAIAGMEQALDGQRDEHAIRSALNRLRLLELGGMDTSDSEDPAGSTQPAFAFLMAQFDQQVRAAATIQHAYCRHRPPPRPFSARSMQSGRSRSTVHSVTRNRGATKHSRPTTASRYMGAALARSRKMRGSNSGDEGLTSKAHARLASWRSRFNPVGGLTSKRLSDIGKLELMPSIRLPHGTDPMQRIADMCAGASKHDMQTQEQHGSAGSSVCGMHTDEDDEGALVNTTGTHMQEQRDSVTTSPAGGHMPEQCGSATTSPTRMKHMPAQRGSVTTSPAGGHVSEQCGSATASPTRKHKPEQRDSATGSPSGMHTQEQSGGAGTTAHSVHVHEPQDSQGKTLEAGKEQMAQQEVVEQEVEQQQSSEEYDESMAAQESPPRIDTDILLEPVQGLQAPDKATIHWDGVSSKHDNEMNRGGGSQTDQGLSGGTSVSTACAPKTLSPSRTAKLPRECIETGSSEGVQSAEEFEKGEGDAKEGASADYGEGAGGAEGQRAASDEEGGGDGGEKSMAAGRPKRVSITGKGPSMAGGVRTRMLLSPLRFATFKPMEKARRAMQDMMPSKRLRKAKTGKMSPEIQEDDGSSSSSYDSADGNERWQIPIPRMDAEHALLSERLIYRDNLGLLKNIAGFAALGSGGMGAAIQRQVATMVGQLQAEEAPVREQANVHLEHIQSLINSAAKLTAARDGERLTIIHALEAELQRLKPCMSPQSPSPTAPHEAQGVRDPLVWRRQQQQEETMKYEAAAAAAAAENEAIAARFTAARKAAQAQREKEEEQAVRLAEATARAMEQENAPETMPSPRKAESQTQDPKARSTSDAPPTTPSRNPRLRRTPSPPKTGKVAMRKRQQIARAQLGNAPSQSRTAPAISPWTRAQMRTHSRKVKEKLARQPVNRQPLYKPPARGNFRGRRILPSTRASPAQVRLAQARIAQELRSRRQIQWAHLDLHEEAWGAEGGRVAGGTRPYLPGAGSGAVAPAHYVLDVQQGLEERIASMMPMVSHLSLKTRMPPDNSSIPQPTQPGPEESLASQPPASAQHTRLYSTLSPAQPLVHLSQSGDNSSTPPATPLAHAHHTRRTSAIATPHHHSATEPQSHHHNATQQSHHHSTTQPQSHHHIPTQPQSHHHSGPLPHHHRSAHVRIATPPQGSQIIPTSGSPIKLRTPASGDSCAPSTLLPPATLLAQQQQQQQQQEQCSEKEDPMKEQVQPCPKQQLQQQQSSEVEPIAKCPQPHPTHHQQQQEPESDQTQQYTQPHSPSRMASTDIPESRAFSIPALGAWGQRPPVPPPYQLYPISAPPTPYSSSLTPYNFRHDAPLHPPRLSHHPVCTTTLQSSPCVPGGATDARAATASNADSALPNFPKTTTLPLTGHRTAMEEKEHVADPQQSCASPSAAPHSPQAKVLTSGSRPGSQSSPAPTAQSPFTNSAHPVSISSAPMVHPGSPTHPQRSTAQPQRAPPAMSIEAATALHAVTPTHPHLMQHQGIPEVAGRGSVKSTVPHSGVQQQQQQQASQLFPGTAAALEAQQHHQHHQHHQLRHQQRHQHQQHHHHHHYHRQRQSPAEGQIEAPPRLPQLPKTPPSPSKTEQSLQKESHRQQQLASPPKEQQIKPLPPAVDQKPLPSPVVNTVQQQSGPPPALPPLPMTTTPNPTPRGPFPPQMPFIPTPPPSACSHMNPHTRPTHTTSRFSRTHSAPPLSSAYTAHRASHSSPSPHQMQPHQAPPPANEMVSPSQGLPMRLSRSRPVNPEGPLSSMAPPPTPSGSARAWVSVMRAPPPGLVLSPSSPPPPARGSARKRRTHKKGHSQMKIQQQEQHRERRGSDTEEQFQQQQQQQQTATPPMQKPEWHRLLYSPRSSVAGRRSAGGDEQGLTQDSTLMGQLAHHPPAAFEGKKGGLFQTKCAPGMPGSGSALWYLPGAIRSSKRGQAIMQTSVEQHPSYHQLL